MWWWNFYLCLLSSKCIQKLCCFFCNTVCESMYINFSIYIYIYIYIFFSSIYTVYKADVSNNKTDEHKYYYCISDTPFKERYEKHETSFRHRSHLTASDLSKYYWKLVDNDAVLTIKFSIAKRVTPLLITTTYA